MLRKVGLEPPGPATRIEVAASHDLGAGWRSSPMHSTVVGLTEAAPITVTSWPIKIHRRWHWMPRAVGRLP